MSEEEFGELRSLAGGADALAHLGHGGSDGLGEVAVAVGAGVDAGAAADALRGILHAHAEGIDDVHRADLGTASFMATTIWLADVKR